MDVGKGKYCVAFFHDLLNMFVEPRACSTLLKTITQYGEGKPAVAGSPIVIKGDLYKHPSLRIAYYQQLQQECLPYELSPIQVRYLPTYFPLALLCTFLCVVFLYYVL